MGITLTLPNFTPKGAGGAIAPPLDEREGRTAGETPSLKVRSTKHCRGKGSAGGGQMSGPARPEEGSSPCPARLSDGSRTGVDGRTRRSYPPYPLGGGDGREGGYAYQLWSRTLGLGSSSARRLNRTTDRATAKDRHGGFPADGVSPKKFYLGNVPGAGARSSTGSMTNAGPTCDRGKLGS